MNVMHDSLSTIHYKLLTINCFQKCLSNNLPYCFGGFIRVLYGVWIK